MMFEIGDKVKDMLTGEIKVVSGWAIPEDDRYPQCLVVSTFLYKLEGEWVPENRLVKVEQIRSKSAKEGEAK